MLDHFIAFVLTTTYLFFIPITIGKYAATKQWHSQLNNSLGIDTDLRETDLPEALIDYQNFRVVHAAHLINIKKFLKAQAYLNAIPAERRSYDIYVLLGICNEESDIDKAIKYLDTATKYIPNRMMPRLNIASLFLKQKDTLSASKTARESLQIPQKVYDVRNQNIRLEIMKISSLK